MKNRTFEMNGKTYNSMMDIARELGVKRIYTRDFDKFGVVETTVMDDACKTDTDVKFESFESGNKTDSSHDENKCDERHIRRSGTKDEIEQAQKLAKNGTIVEFSDYIKHFSVDALVQMSDEAGLDTWSTISNTPIRKMRLIMGLKSLYFPGEKFPVKTVSGWSAFELDRLIKIADEHSLVYKSCSNIKIQRMYVTRALKEAGVNPQDYTGSGVTSA